MISLVREEMPVQCAGCAFRPGTEAHADTITVLTAELCVQAGEPFFCHANAVADKLPFGEERICRGFLDECDRRGPIPPWKAAVASEGLRLMEEAKLGTGSTLSGPETVLRLVNAGRRAL